MAKFERVLSLFPAVYGAMEPHKLLHETVRRLAQPMEEADTHIYRIQRSHRLLVAEHIEDILRLAAVLNLTAFHFDDLIDNETLTYSQKLALMRQRVQQVVQIHLKGLGTPWAVMQAAATFINATIVRKKPDDPLIKHLDANGFSHRAAILFTHLPEQRYERIYLHENPYRRRKIELAQQWAPASWQARNESIDTSSVRLVIQGMSDHTVLPSLYCPQTQEGLLFQGVVPNGKTLTVDATHGAILDGRRVDDWLIHFKGGVFDSSQMDTADLVREQGDTMAILPDELENIPSRPYQLKKTIPTVPIGHSQWEFNVAEGTCDGDLYDFAVYSTPHRPIGTYDGDTSFDESVFEYDASAVVGMAWDERVPCAFKLLLPPRVPQPTPQSAEVGSEHETASDAANYVGRVGSVMPRFQAAGVRVFVDHASDTWILGESILRDIDAAEGKGIDFHSTRLRHPHTEMLVSLDLTS